MRRDAGTSGRSQNVHPGDCVRTYARSVSIVVHPWFPSFLSCVCRFMALSGALVGVAVFFPMHAANVRPVAIESLASQAERVVHGTVASLENLRDPSMGIRTRVELEVRETWKGPSTNRFILALAGGTLGNRRVVVTGQPEFRVGEEVVVFTLENPRGEGVLLELAQGKFGVHRDAAGAAWVHNPFFGSRPESAGATNTPAYRPPSQLPVSLGELKRRVQSATTVP